MTLTGRSLLQLVPWFPSPSGHSFNRSQTDLASRPSLASRPIALRRVDCHAVWLSPRALELTKEHLGGTFPSSVPGGEIIRDSNGEPTGVFVDAAEGLVPVPKWSKQTMREYAKRAFKDALSVGLTSVHDASTSVPEFELFKEYVQILSQTTVADN